MPMRLTVQGQKILFRKAPPQSSKEGVWARVPPLGLAATREERVATATHGQKIAWAALMKAASYIYGCTWNTGDIIQYVNSQTNKISKIQRPAAFMGFVLTAGYIQAKGYKGLESEAEKKDVINKLIEAAVAVGEDISFIGGHTNNINTKGKVTSIVDEISEIYGKLKKRYDETLAEAVEKRHKEATEFINKIMKIETPVKKKKKGETAKLGFSSGPEYRDFSDFF